MRVTSCRICCKAGAGFFAGAEGPFHFGCMSRELDRVASLPPTLGEYGLAAVPVPAELVVTPCPDGLQRVEWTT